MLAFFSLTFLLSWSAWAVAILLPEQGTLLRILGIFGPAIAAVILLYRSAQGVLPTLKRLLIWRFPMWIYVLAFGLTFAGCLIALLLARLTTGLGEILPEATPIYVPFLVFIYVMAFSVAGEELGWRGYALPRLLENYNPIRASLIVGVVWAVWHTPLFLMPSNFHSDIPFGPFAVQVIASSLIYTYLHLVTNGSLLIVHIFHASFNTSVGLLPILPTVRDGDTTAFYIAVGLLVIVAAAIAIHFVREPS
ncbi:hypothetical protein A8B78_10070 [Jannaschia sp. EhC01]|nr:hypothetical protein A8B78_10070 [Jannaschia sp. EhC01]